MFFLQVFSIFFTIPPGGSRGTQRPYAGYRPLSSIRWQLPNSLTTGGGHGPNGPMLDTPMMVANMSLPQNLITILTISIFRKKALSMGFWTLHFYVGLVIVTTLYWHKSPSLSTTSIARSWKMASTCVYYMSSTKDQTLTQLRPCYCTNYKFNNNKKSLELYEVRRRNEIKTVTQKLVIINVSSNQLNTLCNNCTNIKFAMWQLYVTSPNLTAGL